MVVVKVALVVVVAVQNSLLTTATAVGRWHIKKLQGEK
jgi:hypothetical protein